MISWSVHAPLRLMERVKRLGLSRNSMSFASTNPTWRSPRSNEQATGPKPTSLIGSHQSLLGNGNP